MTKKIIWLEISVIKLFEQKALLFVKNKARHEGAGLIKYIGRSYL
jgi:hypothetical protein